MESNVTLEDLLKRIDKLEREVTDLRGRIPQADEDTIMAITAAVAAYMGVKAKVRAINYANQNTRWAAAGRRAVHNRNIA